MHAHVCPWAQEAAVRSVEAELRLAGPRVGWRGLLDAPPSLEEAERLARLWVEASALVAQAASQAAGG